jgi:micrococcal nuclease
MARSRAVLAAVAAVALLGSAAAGWWAGGVEAADVHGTVVEVVDGDTLVVDVGGRRDTVRLLGVDTPETVDPDEPVQCFGPEASAHTERRLLGRRVRLERDVELRDRYGRRLAHVHVDGVRFNDELLVLGYARLLVVPPDTRHAREMLRLELDARAKGRGLWAAC